MLKPLVNVFVIGKTLIQAKETMVNFAIEKAKSEGTNVVAAERKAHLRFSNTPKTNWRNRPTSAVPARRLKDRCSRGQRRSRAGELYCGHSIADEVSRERFLAALTLTRPT
ncbi:hypothetical protein [Caballeronia sp. GAFFF1]|uniref:hypothetical protein n=1 Tax=Caballeronia sp. GAFFF1 TaxID=2921779 RepID=UPI00202808EF|nr:hypothetical protein [Caballeronia sp. GAFFF1]